MEPAGFVLTTENLGDLSAAMLAAKTYSTTMVTAVAGTSMTSEGQARVTDAGTEMTMTMGTPEMPSPMGRIRLVGGQMYIDVGTANAEGKFWQIETPPTRPTRSPRPWRSPRRSPARRTASRRYIPALVSVEKSGPEEQLDGVGQHADTLRRGGRHEQDHRGRCGAVRVRRRVRGRDPRADHLHVLDRLRPAAAQACDGHARPADRDDVQQLGWPRDDGGSAADRVTTTPAM